MNIRAKLVIIISVLSIALSRFSVAGETNVVVKAVLVRMPCKCGGEMKPTGVCLTSYPPQYPHVCDKCGTNATYRVSYPEIRYISE